MYAKSRCIIIKNIDFRDTDKLITVFSEQDGKFRAVAKGVKKPNSSLRPCVQPFVHAFLFFSPSKELGLITQGRVLDFYGNIRDDINLSLNTIYIMELLDKSLLDNVPIPRLYNHTLQILNILNNDEITFTPLIIRYYEMTLLQELGYKPVLDYCVLCHNTNTSLGCISISEGGTVCSNCIKQTSYNINISGETLAILKLLTSPKINTIFRVKPSLQARQQIELVLERYLEYHLERKFNVKDTIKKLKQKLKVLN